MAQLNPEIRDELDRRVYDVMLLNPTPAIDICTALGLDWALDAHELRGSLLRLQEQGKAALTYGRGWAKL